MLEVLVRSNNLTLVEKLISKLISKIYKIHNPYSEMKNVTCISHSFCLPHPYLTEETKGDSTLPPNFLLSALQTWKPWVLSFTLGSIFPFNLEVRGFFRWPEFEGKSVFLCHKWTVQQETSNQMSEQNKSELNICIYESHNMEAISSVYQVIHMSAKNLCECTANLLWSWNMNSSMKE